MHSADEDASDHIVWDVLDPFAPPDPTLHRLHTLIQAEIARMRKYESIGPLQSIRREYTAADDEPKRIILPRPICHVASPTDEDEAEAKERARKAKRDAHRSYLKVLAILGPEAATAMASGSQF